MTTNLPRPGAAHPAIAPVSDDALRVLLDVDAPLPDRVAIYGVLQMVKLRIERALRKVKADMAADMVRAGTPEIGPVRAVWQARDVYYPCNAPGNWADDGVQTALRDVIRPVAPEYVRHIPDHYEIDTAKLAKGIAAGDPVAAQLWRELDARKWRRSDRRDLVLKVKEPPR